MLQARIPAGMVVRGVRLLLPPGALVVAALTAVAASAQDAGMASPAAGCECIYERLAFAAADSNADGLVGEAEFARDVAAAFTKLDQDFSGTLTPDELGEHDPARFALVDSDGDGALSFAEVMTYKMRAFKAADVDGDGYLSFEEMYAAALADLGGNR